MTAAQEMARARFERAEILRSEEPVLWAVVRGRGGVPRIALLLGWPELRVTEALDEYVELGTLKISSGRVYNLDQESPRWEDLQKMKELYFKIEGRIVENYGGVIDPNDVASAVKKEHKEQMAAARKARAKSTLTDVQWSNLMGVWDNFHEEQFRTIEFARAQGRTSSGWSKSYLENLVNKGLLRVVKKDVRLGATWQLTELGVEKASAADEKD